MHQSAEQQALADYTEKSAAAVQSLVKAKQDEMLSGLKARAKKAAEEASHIAQRSDFRLIWLSTMRLDWPLRLERKLGEKRLIKY